MRIASRIDFRSIKDFKALDFILFSDDTNIFFSHTKTQINWRKLWILNWRNYQAGFRLTSFLLTWKQNRQKLDLHFSINDTETDRVNEVLFLGVILDENLSWKSQIQNIASKVSKSVGIIYKSSWCLNKTSSRTLYYSLVYPYLHYCASVLGSTYHSNLKSFVTL